MPLPRIAVLFVLILACDFVQAQTPPEFEVQRAEGPPVIDGVLDDAIWDRPSLTLGDWLSYNPLYGERAVHPTQVWIAYDERSLYFAFHALDAEPGRIRTTISRRDNVFNDDWIGLSLDSAGTGQSAYHLFVNPSGIQMDAVNAASGGERFEADLVWKSAGALTADGYSVELELPLESIRYAGGSVVRMGILFWRRISRTGVSYAWPDLPPGQWVFHRHAGILLRDLRPPRLLELLPNITYGRSQTRGANAWQEAVGRTEAGLSAKYGLTSTITLDATINPDFSQVESDAFQVQTNQRFPTFFSEKRPFFMEGMGLFNLAGSGGDGNMRTAVHTRRVVDPAWGAKLTGTAGRLAFVLLSAADENAPDAGGPAPAVPRKFFNIGRATYTLGQSSYAGALLTHSTQAGRVNRVVGGDVSVHYAGRQRVSATWLASRTAEDQVATDGSAAQVSYSYSRPSFAFNTQVEHYDRGFEMDPAFYNRRGFTSGWTYAEVNFYPSDRGPWIRRITPFTWQKLGRDRQQDGVERTHMAGLRLNFTRQGFLRIHRSWQQEPWAGREFSSGRTLVTGNAQILPWLNINGSVDWGERPFYDPETPFQGRSMFTNAGVTLQPNARINQNVSWSRTRFVRASTGEPVYTIHLGSLRTTYQFSERLFARAIAQYDSGGRRILTDFLASYEPAPGTVFHAGYGALLERTGADAYRATQRGLFFKASYLHRF